MTLTSKLQQIEQLRKHTTLAKFIDSLHTNINFNTHNIYHSNLIEGINVTEQDTLNIILGNNTMIYYEEGEEVIGLHNALQYMYANIHQDLSHELILGMFNNLNSEEQYRTCEVGTYRIDNGEWSSYPLSRYVYSLMDDLIDFFNKPLTLEQICELKLAFIHIHPFSDGNGRMSRLLLNWALIKNGYPPITILVQDKDEYIYSLMEYGDSNYTKPQRFIEFIANYLLQTYTLP